MTDHRFSNRSIFKILLLNWIPTNFNTCLIKARSMVGFAAALVFWYAMTYTYTPHNKICCPDKFLIKIIETHIHILSTENNWKSSTRKLWSIEVFIEARSGWIRHFQCSCLEWDDNSESWAENRNTAEKSAENTKSTTPVISFPCSENLVNFLQVSRNFELCWCSIDLVSHLN